MPGLRSDRQSAAGGGTPRSGQRRCWGIDSFKAGVQIWLVEWRRAGRSPWGATGMNEAGGVPYTTRTGFGPRGNGLDGLCQANEQRLVGSDLLST